MFFIFFTINQLLAHTFLIAVLIIVDYDTTLIVLNYLIMLLIGMILLALANYESPTNTRVWYITLGLFIFGLVITFIIMVEIFSFFKFNL
ncbi:MAG: hypothetical protein ACFFB5_23285 [Promethearchaeota archaeon]